MKKTLKDGAGLLRDGSEILLGGTGMLLDGAGRLVGGAGKLISSTGRLLYADVPLNPLNLLPLRRRTTTPGEMPGTLRAAEDAQPTQMRAFAIGPKGHLEEKIESLAELDALRAQWPVVWIDVVGLGGVKQVRKLARTFGFHPLALEDVFNTGQRVKLETYEDHLFMIAHMATRNEEVSLEQLGVFVTEQCVVTFQEHEGDCFENVRKRIRSAGTRFHEHGADYVAYSLLDAIVDHFQPLLDHIEEQLGGLEIEIFRQRGDRDLLTAIHATRRDLNHLRWSIRPLVTVLDGLLGEAGTGLVKESTRPYLRDLYDHVNRAVEQIEFCRTWCADLMDYHLSMVGNRMNEVMKVLTVVASIFIPLGFVAGLYGMNFNPEVSGFNMPETQWAYGYPFALGLMATIAAGLLLLFRRKRWI